MKLRILECLFNSERYFYFLEQIGNASILRIGGDDTACGRVRRLRQVSENNN
jgi:hypothetical protein